MGTVDLKLARFYVLKDRRDEFLSTLQKRELVQLKPVEEEDLGELEVEVPRDVEEELTKIKTAIEVLKPYAPPKSLLESFVDLKPDYPAGRLKELVESGEYRSVVEEVIRINEELSRSRNRVASYEVEIEKLEPWTPMTYRIEELRGEEFVAQPGFVPADRAPLLSSLAESYPLEVEEVNRSSAGVYVILFYRKEDAAEVRDFMQEVGFEAATFGGYEGRVADVVESLKRRKEEELRKQKEWEDRLSRLGEKLLDLMAVHDFFYFAVARRESEKGAKGSHYFVVYEGWYDPEREGELRSIVESADYVEAEFAESDDPNKPVKFKNRPWAKPFEILTALYGVPKPGEVDPSPFLGPFFLVGFALCLTDAGYGIVLGLISLYLAKKLPKAKTFLYMMAAGGFLTVFAGAMVGSWFGDLFDSMKNVPVLSLLYALKTHTMLFDPTKGKGPLIFFGISIVVGVLHIFTGMLLDAWQKFRDGNVLGALVEDIGWILVIGGFVGSIIVAPVLRNVGFFGLAMVFVLGCLRGKVWYQKLLGGFKELYGGIGFVGDIFSYVRLMALGMVTGGIAQSMNLLAKLVWVSNRGVILAVVTGIVALVILVFGHLFSVAINTLGAFVHSLRLQYVEFFTKFYEGGGKLFKPLSLKGLYVDVVDEGLMEKK